MLKILPTENGIAVYTESDETIINLSGKTPEVEDSDAFPPKTKKLLQAIKKDQSLKSTANTAHNIEIGLKMAVNLLKKIVETEPSDSSGQFSKILSERSEKMKGVAGAVCLMLIYIDTELNTK